MSGALEYHRATNVAAGASDEEPRRELKERPPPFKNYGDAPRVPLDATVSGGFLQDGAGIVRSQEGRDYGGGTMHWRAYSSAGGLFPVEAYVASPEGLYSFDALSRAFVPLAVGDMRARVAAAAVIEADMDELVVLTGIHARTGWKYGERGYRHVWWDAGTMLANLLALAAADDLSPRLHVGFVDAALNDALGLDGRSEYALAVLALRTKARRAARAPASGSEPQAETGRRFVLAEGAHAASLLHDEGAVRKWRANREVCGSEPQSAVEEPKLARDELLSAIRARRSVRRYGTAPLPRDALAELLAWSEAPIPVDAPRVVEQRVTVAAVEGLEPGIYDAELNLLHVRREDELRERVGFAAMEQEHPRDAAVNVFQLAHVADVVERLGDRGYRWAQLEAGIRAGRLQIGAFIRGWGAAASTFYDDETSRALETDAAPLLMVSLGPRA